MISFEEFKNAELKIGMIREAARVEGSDKLLKLAVDLCEKDENGAPKLRQLVAGIGKAYTPEALVGKQIVVVANLEPRTFTLRHGSSTEAHSKSSGQVGLESQGMLLAAADETGPVLLVPERPVAPGEQVR